MRFLYFFISLFYSSVLIKKYETVEVSTRSEKGSRSCGRITLRRTADRVVVSRWGGRQIVWSYHAEEDGRSCGRITLRRATDRVVVSPCPRHSLEKSIGIFLTFAAVPIALRRDKKLKHNDKCGNTLRSNQINENIYPSQASSSTTN